MKNLNLIKKLIAFLVIFGISIAFIDEIFMKLLARDYPEAQQLNILLKYFSVENLDIFFKSMTSLGQLAGIVIVVASIVIIILFSKEKEKFYNLLLKCITAFFISGVITTVLKVIICRERPFVMWNPHHFYGGIKIFSSHVQNKDAFFSCPSGHTTAAFALSGILYMFTEKRFYKIVFIILPILVAISRIYLGRHFLSDTLAGGTVGYFTAVIINKYNFYEIFNKKNK